MCTGTFNDSVAPKSFPNASGFDANMNQQPFLQPGENAHTLKTIFLLFVNLPTEVRLSRRTVVLSLLKKT